jgi:hypothetical protein
MDEVTLLTTLFNNLYNAQDSVLSRLSESSLHDGYLVYQAQHISGISWTIHAYRRNRLIPEWFRYFYPWLKHDMLDWLSTRAATLTHLEQQAYPAPRVIRTRTNELVGVTDEWCMLVTTFIGTLHLSQVLQTESPGQIWIDSMNRRWARLQNRWNVSDKIATIARERLERHIR